MQDRGPLRTHRSRSAPPGRGLPPALVIGALAAAREASQIGCAESAIQTLRLLVTLAPGEAEAWRLLGFAYADEQRLPEAAAVFAQAASLEPREPRIAMAHAHATFDAGFPAVHLFERALEIAPGDLQVQKGLAAALTAQGRPAAAA